MKVMAMQFNQANGHSMSRATILLTALRDSLIDNNVVLAPI